MKVESKISPSALLSALDLEKSILRGMSIQPHEAIETAKVLMERHSLEHLPVVDVDGQLLGVVSRGDLSTFEPRAEAPRLGDLPPVVAYATQQASHASFVADATPESESRDLLRGL